MFSIFVPVTTIFISLRIWQAESMNMHNLPDIMALDSFSRLYDGLRTYNVSYSLHLWDSLSRTLMFNSIVPIPNASTENPSSMVISSAMSSFLKFINFLTSWQMWHIAPESTIQSLFQILMFVWLVSRLVGWFYGVSTFVGYLMLNLFLYK